MLMNKVTRAMSRNYVRQFSGNSYQAKSSSQVWFSDKGTWPVIFCTAFGMFFVAGWGFNTMGTHPDCRISKTSRKNLFRGELMKESRDVSV